MIIKAKFNIKYAFLLFRRNRNFYLDVHFGASFNHRTPILKYYFRYYKASGSCKRVVACRISKINELPELVFAKR